MWFHTEWGIGNMVTEEKSGDAKAPNYFQDDFAAAFTGQREGSSAEYSVHPVDQIMAENLGDLDSGFLKKEEKTDGQKSAPANRQTGGSALTS